MDMQIYQEAFGASDKTTSAMRDAIAKWFSLYYDSEITATSDPSQRLPYTLVNKLMKTVFSEYAVTAGDPHLQGVLDGLTGISKAAMQLALIGGESYIKPCPGEAGFAFGVIPRSNVLIFSRNAQGEPTDVGLAEKSTYGRFYYTLLERRTVDGQGCLTIENKLYRAGNAQDLGQEVPLTEQPAYANLQSRYTYGVPVGSVGLVPLRTPMLNCVDGSADSVSIFAPAVGLIENINRNEAQLNGEFDRGESRILVSRDLLDENRQLADHLFVGLDEDPETVGITTFAPQLREQSFLARKQEYLRNVESVIGLKRGMLSDANVDERTATEINSSQSDFNLTVLDFRKMWEEMLPKAVDLCRVLARLYGLPGWGDEGYVLDWGNGVLYDRDAMWQDYRQMVSDGLIKPEIALGWRFHLPAETETQQAAIRKKYMPEKESVDS